MRLILYLGKGGVGKTTLAAATAARSAQLGKRTLVVSTDLAHSLADALDTTLAAEPRQIAPNLWAQEINALDEVRNNWGKVQEYLATSLKNQGMSDVAAEEMALIPGMDEIVALLHIHRQAQEGTFDVIVVDAAPTGETVRLLSMPETFLVYANRLKGWRSIALSAAKPLLRQFLPGVNVLESLEKLNDQVAVLRATLTDPDISSYRLVVNPEKMVIKEALRAETYLALYDYPIDGVLCNRVLPADQKYHDQLLREMVAQQRGYYDTIHSTFAPLPVWDVPYSSREILGVEALAKLGTQIWAGDDPDEDLLSRQPTAGDEGGRPLRPAPAAAARRAGEGHHDEEGRRAGRRGRELQARHHVADGAGADGGDGGEDGQRLAGGHLRGASARAERREQLARMSDETPENPKAESVRLAERAVQVAGLRIATAMNDVPRFLLARVPLVVLPAANHPWQDYRLILERFAPERRVFALDWPGFGASDKPAPADFAYSIQRYAEILAGWMDSLGIARAVFVGNSVGAGAAIQYAAAHPQRTLGLLLVAPAGFTPPGITRWTAARFLGTPGDSARGGRRLHVALSRPDDRRDARGDGPAEGTARGPRLQRLHRGLRRALAQLRHARRRSERRRPRDRRARDGSCVARSTRSSPRRTRDARRRRWARTRASARWRSSCPSGASALPAGAGAFPEGGRGAAGDRRGQRRDGELKTSKVRDSLHVASELQVVICLVRPDPDPCHDIAI